MSISGTPRLAGPFAATGAQTVFPFEFRVLSGDAVLVTLADDEGVQTEIVTGYTVDLNADQGADPGGSVVFAAAPTSGTVAITSRTPIEQPAEFSNVGSQYPRVVEDSLDRLTIIAQEQQGLLERAFLAPIGDTPFEIGAVDEGEVLQRAGSTFVGITVDDFAAPAGAARDAAQGFAAAASGSASAASSFADNAGDSADLAAVGASLVSVLSRFYTTIAAGMAASAIGETFSSGESGIVRAYYKTGAATYTMYPLAEQGARGADGAGAGTVTSVGIGGGTSGLSAAAVTVSGNLTITGQLAVAHGGTGAADAPTARANLGLTIGTNVQAYSATLTGWAGKTVPAGVVADLTSTQTLSGKTLTAPTVTGYTETVSAPAAASAFAPNLATATAFYYQTNANAAITLPAPVAGKSFTICVRYGGAHTLTWAGGARKWPGGVVPTPTSVNGKEDEFVFRCYDGANWLASKSGGNF